MLTELALAVGRDPKDGTVRRVRDMLLGNGQLVRREDGRTERCHGATVPDPGGCGTWQSGTDKPDERDSALVAQILQTFPGTVEISEAVA